MSWNSHESDDSRAVYKGVIAGVAAGLVASWVMNRFQAGLSAPQEERSDAVEEQSDAQDENATVGGPPATS
jgi:hypothetical protein